jgi:lantibiotic modifying enzyme
VFLATLGRATGDDRFLTLAARAARGVVTAVLDGRVHVGGFVGVPSQLYALAQVDAIVGGGDLARVLEPALERLAPALAQTRDADIIYGAAGAILALVEVLRATGRDAVIPHLRACLAVLERTAVTQDVGVAWPGERGRPLLGFSHGNAGVACALARLGDVLDGDPAAVRCAALADAALCHERARYDASRGNWPDFRAREPEGRSLVAWCHGGPGGVLGRLAVLGDAATAAELEAGVATALAGDAHGGHTLCHGDVGNLAIVAHAAHRLGRDDWRAGVAARLPRLLDAIAGCPGVDSAFPDAAPGLMTGRAGVGHGLLMLARPLDVPFVLALEPPPAAPVRLP